MQLSDTICISKILECSESTENHVYRDGNCPTGFRVDVDFTKAFDTVHRETFGRYCGKSAVDLKAQVHETIKLVLISMQLSSCHKGQ